MNKVKALNPISTSGPEEGDIYSDKDDGELSIFSQVMPNKFCLINLSSGNRFRDPSPDKLAVVQNHNFVGRGMTITIG